MARSDRSQGAFLTETPLGAVGLLWRETGGGPKVERVLLPAGPRAVAERLKRDFPDRKLCDSPEVAELGRRIDRFLHGSRSPSTWGFPPLPTAQAFSVKC
ncbi:MAG: hypothetical protein NT125_03575, partial [Candidatus Bipolaricaulota bacterium]|nr:hypothetical protein [Candidatus Bipolaricaulota bacterium]